MSDPFDVQVVKQELEAKPSKSRTRRRTTIQVCRKQFERFNKKRQIYVAKEKGWLKQIFEVFAWKI